MIALQKIKIRRSDIRQTDDGTLVIRGKTFPSQNASGVGFVVHLSVIHLVDSYEILLPRLAILAFTLCAKNPSKSSTATRQHQQLMIPDLMRSPRSWMVMRSDLQQKVLLQHPCRDLQRKSRKGNRRRIQDL
ncbi:hypothetical protein RB195_021019 [Necator americanus]|uniref:Uncharacterized protein n=1 Tax=Necator americanus TaxID=51031 RepID=A0ABR1CLV3_NECAM